MDVGIEVLESEEGGRGSDVAVLVPVGFGFRVVADQEHVGSDIKLSAIIEQRF